MILKEQQISKVLEKLFALFRRLRDNHPEKKFVNIDLQKKLAEKRGEEAVDYFLQFLDQEVFHILQSIRIPDQQGFFQIDRLVLAPYFILILEVKNWRGTILFGENGQVTRVKEDGIKEGFSNPIPQVHLQRYRLRKWLQQKGFTNIPIHVMVVISFPSTIIESINQEMIPEEVIHNNKLIFRINNLADNHEKVITPNVIHQIANELIMEDTPEDKDIMSTYNIQADELIKGVICEQCSYYPMIWHQSKMCCPKCKANSRDSYLDAIEDYALLIGNQAKNSEIRDFLQIDSPHVMKRLMQKAGFARFGNTNGRKYTLNKRYDTNNSVR